MQVTFDYFVPDGTSLTVETGVGYSTLNLAIPVDFFFVDTGDKEKFLFEMDKDSAEVLHKMLTEALRYMNKVEEG